MLHFDEIVFGPIRSRRLGSSLGVNLLPSKVFSRHFLKRASVAAE